MKQATKRIDSKGRRLPDGISCRNDGRYQARFVFNGKRYTIYDEDLCKLKVKMKSKKAELECGIFGTIQSMTLNEWFYKWIEVYKKNKLKPITFENYKKYWKWYVADTIGGKKLGDIKRIQIIALYNSLIDGEKGLASSTVAYINNILCNALEQAEYNELITRNPAKDVMKEITKTTPARKDALNHTQESLFLDYIDGHKFFDRYKPMFTIALNTGLRVGELTALTWEDVDFDNKEINVDKTLHLTRFVTEDGHRYLINSPKTQNAVRKVPMTNVVIDAFKKQKLYQDRLSLRHNVVVNGYSNFVFNTQNGKPYFADLVNFELKRITKVQNKEELAQAKAEEREPILLEYFSSHIMRHTFATRCFEKGVDVKVLQKIMGHARLDTTMDIYTHCSQEIVEEEMKKLE